MEFIFYLQPVCKCDEVETHVALNIYEYETIHIIKIKILCCTKTSLDRIYVRDTKKPLCEVLEQINFIDGLTMHFDTKALYCNKCNMLNVKKNLSYEELSNLGEIENQISSFNKTMIKYNSIMSNIQAYDLVYKDVRSTINVDFSKSIVSDEDGGLYGWLVDFAETCKLSHDVCMCVKKTSRENFGVTKELYRMFSPPSNNIAYKTPTFNADEYIYLRIAFRTKYSDKNIYVDVYIDLNKFTYTFLYEHSPYHNVKELIDFISKYIGVKNYTWTQKNIHTRLIDCAKIVPFFIPTAIRDTPLQDFFIIHDSVLDTKSYEFGELDIFGFKTKFGIVSNVLSTGKYEVIFDFENIPSEGDKNLISNFVATLIGKYNEQEPKIHEWLDKCKDGLYDDFVKLHIREKRKIIELRDIFPDLYITNSTKLTPRYNYSIYDEKPSVPCYEMYGKYIVVNDGFAISSIVNTLANQRDYPNIPTSIEIGQTNSNPLDVRRNTYYSTQIYKHTTQYYWKRSFLSEIVIRNLFFNIENEADKYNIEGTVFSEASILHILCSIYDEDYKETESKFAKCKSNKTHERLVNVLDEIVSRRRQKIKDKNISSIVYAQDVGYSQYGDITRGYVDPIAYRRVLEEEFCCNIVIIEQISQKTKLLSFKIGTPQHSLPYIHKIDDKRDTVVVLMIKDDQDYRINNKQCQQIVISTGKKSIPIRLLKSTDPLVNNLKILSNTLFSRVRKLPIQIKYAQYISGDGKCVGILVSKQPDLWFHQIAEPIIDLDVITQLNEHNLIELDRIKREYYDITTLDIRNNRIYGVWCALNMNAFVYETYIPVKLVDIALHNELSRKPIKICLAFSRTPEIDSRPDPELYAKFVYDLCILLIQKNGSQNIDMLNNYCVIKNGTYPNSTFEYPPIKSYFQSEIHVIKYYKKRCPFLFDDSDRLIVHPSIWSVFSSNAECNHLRHISNFQRRPDIYTYHFYSCNGYESYLRTYIQENITIARHTSIIIKNSEKHYIYITKNNVVHLVSRQYEASAEPKMIESFSAFINNSDDIQICQFPCITGTICKWVFGNRYRLVLDITNK